MPKTNGHTVVTPRTEEERLRWKMRLKIREIYDGGVSQEAIAAVMDVPLDLVRVFCQREKPGDS